MLRRKLRQNIDFKDLTVKILKTKALCRRMAKNRQAAKRHPRADIVLHQLLAMRGFCQGLIGGLGRYQAVPSHGLGDCPVAEACNQWFPPSDGLLHRRERQGSPMALLAIPDFRNPDCVCVRWTLCDHVTQAAGHVGYAVKQDGDQGFALSRDSDHFAN